MTEHLQLTRRRLLAAGGAAVATAAVPSTARAARKPVPSWQDREALTACVGETFVMRGADGSSVATQLKAVRDVLGTTARGRSLKGRADAYLLVFKPVSGTPAGEGIRTFSHQRLGSTQLFAIATDTTYEVLVNRSFPLGTANRWSQAAVRMRRKPRKPRARRRRIRR